jgi:hypothetical protein
LSDKAIEVADSSGLTDADWSEIGKFQQAHNRRRAGPEEGDGRPVR